MKKSPDKLSLYEISFRLCGKEPEKNSTDNEIAIALNELISYVNIEESDYFIGSPSGKLKAWYESHCNFQHISNHKIFNYASINTSKEIIINRQDFLEWINRISENATHHKAYPKFITLYAEYHFWDDLKISTKYPEIISTVACACYSCNIKPPQDNTIPSYKKVGIELKELLNAINAGVLEAYHNNVSNFINPEIFGEATATNAPEITINILEGYIPYLDKIITDREIKTIYFNIYNHSSLSFLENDQFDPFFAYRNVKILGGIKDIKPPWGSTASARNNH